MTLPSLSVATKLNELIGRDSDALLTQPSEYGGIMRGDPAEATETRRKICCTGTVTRKYTQPATVACGPGGLMRGDPVEATKAKAEVELEKKKKTLRDSDALDAADRHYCWRANAR